MFKIERVGVSIFGSMHITNTYIIYDDVYMQAIIIDPGDEKQKIIDCISRLKLKPVYVILTHGHADHLGALEDITCYYNIKVLMHENDIGFLNGKKDGCYEMLGVKKPNISVIDNIVCVKDNEKIKLGEIELEIIHTPGHTDGSICVYESSTNSLITGDTIFANCYGRCDLDSGSFSDMKKSVGKIFERFNDETIIYPGHNEITNLGTAKKYINLLIAIKGE